jgi:hypothetical protein
MTMFPANIRSSSLLTAAVCAAALAGCGVAPEGDDVGRSAQPLTATISTDCQHQNQNLLAGPWVQVSSDLTPANSFSVDGNSINLNWSGYYRWNGTWASGFRGYTFEQPVSVVAGGSYRLTLTVSSLSNPIPAVLRVSLSGAGAEQQQMTQSNATLTYDFTVSGDPGATPVLDVTAHPALGHIGPVEGTGILIQSYTVTASLTRL